MRSERDLQRRLLVAECELQRALLRQDYGTMAAHGKALAARLATWQTVAEAGIALAAGWQRAQEGPTQMPAPPAGAPERKPSRWWSLVEGVQLARALWAACTAPPPPPR